MNSSGKDRLCYTSSKSNKFVSIDLLSITFADYGLQKLAAEPRVQIKT